MNHCWFCAWLHDSHHLFHYEYVWIYESSKAGMVLLLSWKCLLQQCLLNNQLVCFDLGCLFASSPFWLYLLSCKSILLTHLSANSNWYRILNLFSCFNVFMCSYSVVGFPGCDVQSPSLFSLWGGFLNLLGRSSSWNSRQTPAESSSKRCVLYHKSILHSWNLHANRQIILPISPSLTISW